MRKFKYRTDGQVETNPARVEAIIRRNKIKASGTVPTWTKARWLNDRLIVEFLKDSILPELEDKLPTSCSELKDIIGAFLQADAREIYFFRFNKDLILRGRYRNPLHPDRDRNLAGPRDVTRGSWGMLRIDRRDRLDASDRTVARVDIDTHIFDEESHAFRLTMDQFDAIKESITIIQAVDGRKVGQSAAQQIKSYHSRFVANNIGVGVRIEFVTTHIFRKRVASHRAIERKKRAERNAASMGARYRNHLRRTNVQRRVPSRTKRARK